MRQAQRFQGQLEKKEMKSLFSPIDLEIFELASLAFACWQNSL
jgi:hypothetical protein